MNSFSKISKLSVSEINKRISFYAWINKIKKLGKLLFFEAKDSKNYIQVIIKKEELIKKFRLIKKGYLLKLKGIVKKKIEKNIDIDNIEIELLEFKIINKSKNLPFDIEDNLKVNEKTLYNYRYLDFRRLETKKIFIIKSDFLNEIRKFFHKKNFIEIETPVLSQKSPEGSNCFLVPSQLKNRYYTLAQSPQIFKQMLMIGGFNKYYQIAKSFRKEKGRSNRQIEFLQLDVEVSFFSINKITKLIESFLKKTLKKIFNIKANFKTLDYLECIKKYGIDKPKANKSKEGELDFIWIKKWPLFVYNKEQKKYELIRHPFTNILNKQIKLLLKNKIKFEEVICEAFDLVCEGEEILSGSIRINDCVLQKKILEIIGYDNYSQKKNFGYFLEALQFGVPPHGGFGMGIDRLLSVILKKNIKSLIAFPKNIDGTCSVTGTPNFIKKNK